MRRLEQSEIIALEAVDVLLSEELTLRENSRIKTTREWRTSRSSPLTGFDFSFRHSLGGGKMFLQHGYARSERAP